MNYHERIDAAADHLHAIQMDDGRWAHYADETGTWWRFTPDDMAALAEYLDMRDGYSLWCAECPAEELPPCWAPRQEGGDNER